MLKLTSSLKKIPVEKEKYFSENSSKDIEVIIFAINTSGEMSIINENTDIDTEKFHKFIVVYESLHANVSVWYELNKETDLYEITSVKNSANRNI